MQIKPLLNTCKRPTFKLEFVYTSKGLMYLVMIEKNKIKRTYGYVYDIFSVWYVIKYIKI